MTLAPREAELLAHIADGEDGARRVLADLWLDSGDANLRARGTLIHAMHEGRSEVADAILREHGARWCAPLVAAGFRREDLRFEHGFLGSVVFADRHALVGTPELIRLAPAHYVSSRVIDWGRYKATHEALRVTAASSDTVVAVRVSREHPPDGGAYEVERETQLLRRLHDPHVVEVLDTAVATSGPALVMAWAGLDVDVLLDRDRGRYAIEPIAIAVGIQLCRACEAIHAAGMIHAWLRPDHVMVCDGIVRLGSFTNAIADLPLPKGRIRMAAGRLNPAQFDYMSPEQVMALRLSPASDAFSLAALVAALAGRHPLQPTDSDLERVLSIRDLVHHVPDTHSELAPLLRRVLVREEEARPSMAELGDELERVARAAGYAVSPEALAHMLV